MQSVRKAIADGLRVDVCTPLYTEATWKGYRLNNPQVYPGWVTPEEHPAVRSAVEAYTRVASPIIKPGGKCGQLRDAPRVARWIFSTDGVGFPARANGSLEIPDSKRRIRDGAFRYPAMLGIGPGIERTTTRSASASTRASSRPSSPSWRTSRRYTAP